MAPIIYPRYHTSSITLDSAVSVSSIKDQQNVQPRYQTQNPSHNSDIAHARRQDHTQHHNQNDTQINTHTQDISHAQTKAQLRSRRRTPNSKYQIRQLNLDLSTPTQASPSHIAPSTSSTRRVANPTFNDILAPTSNNRQSPSAAAPIRTTRSDNPNFVDNLDIGTSTKSASKEENTEKSDSDSDSKSESKSKSKNDEDEEVKDKDEEEESSSSSPTSTSFIKTTTIKSSSFPSSSKINGNGKSVESSTSGSILNSAVATTNLSWWQLLAIIIGGILALSVGSWLLYRSRQRRKNEKQQLKKENLEDERKRKELKNKELDLLAMGVNDKKTFGHNRRGRGGRNRGRRDYDDDDDDSDEDYDSYSDGGTIRPSRRRRRREKRRRRGRFGHRRRRGRRESDYSDDESELSDSTYYSKYGHHRGGGGISDVEPKSAFSFRPSHSNSNSPKSILTSSNKKKNLNRKNSFRDSVFSTYNSMKKAAVRLKYVEAKVKLDEQLEQEEKLEKERKNKILLANKEIDDYNKSEAIRKATLQENQNHAGIGARSQLNQGRDGRIEDRGGGSQDGWWRDGSRVEEPNENTHNNVNGHNWGNGNGNNQGRNGPNEPRGGKLLIPPVPRQPSKSHSTHDIPTAALLPYNTSPPPNKEKHNSLDGEISNLLGNPKRPEVKRQQTSKSDKRKGVLKNTNTSISPDISISKPEPSYQPSKAPVNPQATQNTQPRFEEPAPVPRSIDQTQNKSRPNFLGIGKSQNQIQSQTQNQGQNQNQNQPKKGYTNPFQIDWLTRPIQSSPTDIEFDQNAHDHNQNPNQRSKTKGHGRDSIYLPITNPNDRPIIPKGDLDPAPPPKATINESKAGIGREFTAGPVSLRGKGSVGFGLGDNFDNPRENTVGGVSGAGGGGGKWANRLRERR